MFVRGLNPGIDFAGGRTFVIRFDKPVVTEDIAAKLNVAFGELASGGYLRKTRSG